MANNSSRDQVPAIYAGNNTKSVAVDIACTSGPKLADRFGVHYLMQMAAPPVINVAQKQQRQRPRRYNIKETRFKVDFIAMDGPTLAIQQSKMTALAQKGLGKKQIILDINWNEAELREAVSTLFPKLSGRYYHFAKRLGNSTVLQVVECRTPYDLKDRLKGSQAYIIPTVVLGDELINENYKFTPPTSPGVTDITLPPVVRDVRTPSPLAVVHHLDGSGPTCFWDEARTMTITIPREANLEDQSCPKSSATEEVRKGPALSDGTLVVPEEEVETTAKDPDDQLTPEGTFDGLEDKESHIEQELSRHLQGLWRRDLLTDITLSCEGQTFRAHRVVLSAFSQTLHSLLVNNNTIETPYIHRGGEINMDNFRISADCLKIVLEFCYSGALPLCEVDVNCMLGAAKTLSMPLLTQYLNKLTTQPEKRAFTGVGRSVKPEPDDVGYSDDISLQLQCEEHSAPSDNDKDYVSLPEIENEMNNMSDGNFRSSSNNSELLKLPTQQLRAFKSYIEERAGCSYSGRSDLVQPTSVSANSNLNLHPQVVSHPSGINDKLLETNALEASGTSLNISSKRIIRSTSEATGCQRKYKEQNRINQCYEQGSVPTVAARNTNTHIRSKRKTNSTHLGSVETETGHKNMKFT